MLPNCNLCDKPVADKVNGLCRTHHILYKQEQWLDNTDIENLGIVRWAMELLPEFLTSAVPYFHKLLYHRLLSLYNPDYKNKYERLYELISFRESAKSTAANTIFCSYILANNGKSIKITHKGEVREFPIDERLITIVSETGGSAEDFTVRIRDTFTTNQSLQYYYKFQIEDALDNITGQWTRAAFKFNSCYVVGVGSGQQIRGKVKGPSRPTLLIVDDIYSENNTITEDRRRRIKLWWNNSAINSIDNVKGKIVVLGTILHDDTILVELRDNPGWTTDIVPMMNVDRFHDFVKKYCITDWNSNTCKLPFDDVKEKDERFKLQRQFFTKVQEEEDWKLSWPERIDLFFVALKYKESVYNGSVAGFYQEYFHITTPPEERRFRKEFFQPMPEYEYKTEFGYNWIKFQDDPEWKNCQTTIGIDLAGGGAGGDDVVITVVTTLANSRIYVLHQAIGKFSLRDDTYSDTSQDLRLKRVIQDRSSLRRIGVVDEVFRLWERYRPSTIKCGVAGEEQQVLEMMQMVFTANRVYDVHITGRPQTVREGKKVDRIKNTLLSYYETRMVYHAPTLSKLEYQLEYLGKSKNDDCADSLECAMWMIEFPYSSLNKDLFEKSLPVKDTQSKRQAQVFDIKHNWREYA